VNLEHLTEWLGATWIPAIDAWESAGFLPDPRADKNDWKAIRGAASGSYPWPPASIYGIAFLSRAGNVSGLSVFTLRLRNGPVGKSGSRSPRPSVYWDGWLDFEIGLPETSFTLKCKRRYPLAEVPDEFPDPPLKGSLAIEGSVYEVAVKTAPRIFQEAWTKAWTAFFLPLRIPNQHEDMFTSGYEGYEDP
jgi:hypothetical protein